MSTGAPISIRLPLDFIERLEKFADANNTSVSEVVREAMTAYREGRSAMPDARRTTGRITIWEDREKYAAFRRKTVEDGERVTDVIQAALEGLL